MGRYAGNCPYRTRSRMELTEIGPVQMEVFPCDRDGWFEPVIVAKRQRRFTGLDHMILALTARGPTTDEVATLFAETYGAKVSMDTISKITDNVIEETTEWCHRPLIPNVALSAPAKALHTPELGATIRALHSVSQDLSCSSV